MCDRPCPCSAHALTADVSVAQTASAAQLFLADGVVLTGTATGHPTDPQQLQGELGHHPGHQGGGRSQVSQDSREGAGAR